MTLTGCDSHGLPAPETDDGSDPKGNARGHRAYGERTDVMVQTSPQPARVFEGGCRPLREIVARKVSLGRFFLWAPVDGAQTTMIVSNKSPCLSMRVP